MFFDECGVLFYCVDMKWIVVVVIVEWVVLDVDVVVFDDFDGLSLFVKEMYVGFGVFKLIEFFFDFGSIDDVFVGVL